eukprot:scpid41491/ scgid24373/ 
MAAAMYCKLTNSATESLPAKTPNKFFAVGAESGLLEETRFELMVANIDDILLLDCAPTTTGERWNAIPRLPVLAHRTIRPGRHSVLQKWRAHASCGLPLGQSTAKIILEVFTNPLLQRTADMRASNYFSPNIWHRSQRFRA